MGLGTGAPTPLGVSGVVDNQVAQMVADDLWQQTTRTNVILERIQARGHMLTNTKHGKYCEWQARIGNHSTAYRADLGQRNFERFQHRVVYSSAYANLEMLAQVSERDLAFLMDDHAVQSEIDTKLAEMGEDFQYSLNNRILNDHTNSNSVFGKSAITVPSGEVAFKGLLEMFGYGATAQDYDFAAQSTSGNIGAGDKEALPNVTYCGVATHPTNAISGVDNKRNESTSPKIANWSSTAWDGSSTTWKANSSLVISHLKQRCNPSANDRTKSDLVLMDLTRYLDFKAQLRSEGVLEVEMDSSPKSPDLGLHPRKHLPFEGLTVCYDDDVPAGLVLMLNTAEMWFNIFPAKPVGGTNTGVDLRGKKKDYNVFNVNTQGDINTGSLKIAGWMLGQLWSNPRRQGAAYNLA